jgi:GDP-L-fucose synthase
MRILITGGGGVIGRNLNCIFKKYKKYTVYAPVKQEMDLLNSINICKVLNDFNPDIIIHTAIKGGIRTNPDTLEIVKKNVEMYENLMNCISDKTKVIIFGSGSEFDRRKNIHNVLEEEIENRYPVDPYGISKNIIVRQALKDPRTYILRLFGCFSHDEEPSRFITGAFEHIRRKIPIEIDQDKFMDFFFIEDVYKVINHLITFGIPKHINLVYQEKYTLIELANFIRTVAGVPDYQIYIKNIKDRGLSYTGNGDKLHSLNIKLIGLEKGLIKVYKNLL